MCLSLEKRRTLDVGRLGKALFPKGFYLYVGSAQKNLPQRLRRHLSREKRNHWHIDYLLPSARIRSIYSYEAPREWECRLSQRIAGLKGVRVVLKGFGSSDCSCPTHLYFFPNIPRVEDIAPKGLRGCAINVGAVCPDCNPDPPEAEKGHCEQSEAIFFCDCFGASAPSQ